MQCIRNGVPAGHRRQACRNGPSRHAGGAALPVPCCFTCRQHSAAAACAGLALAHPPHLLTASTPQTRPSSTHPPTDSMRSISASTVADLPHTRCSVDRSTARPARDSTARLSPTLATTTWRAGQQGEGGDGVALVLGRRARQMAGPGQVRDRHAERPCSCSGIAGRGQPSRVPDAIAASLGAAPRSASSPNPCALGRWWRCSRWYAPPLGRSLQGQGPGQERGVQSLLWACPHHWCAALPSLMPRRGANFG